MTRVSGRMTGLAAHLPPVTDPHALRVARPLWALVASAVVLGAGAAGGVAPQPSCLVSLASGDVQGQDLGATCAFLGIPYAASTAGSDRWRPPQPAPPWTPAIFNATTAVNCASISFFTPGGSIAGSEDCLRVNVWVREAPLGSPAPVIVWLHTGAFTGGSANFAGSNGRKLVEETGVIVVAPNYRLGPFGFLAHSALAAEDPLGTSGNYGLRDQQAALRWVRDNIARFGGDPGNVTLAGTSAGGQSTGLHLVSPAGDGLFHKAAIQSAYPTSRWRSAGEGAMQGDAFAAALGCTDPAEVVACMRAASQESVLRALPVATQQVIEPAGRTFWEPVVDGVIIPHQPRLLYEAGAFHRVPTIIGFNRDEGWGAFIMRSFTSGVSLEDFEAWVSNEFGPSAGGVLGLYPASSFASPMEAMAGVVGDAQFVCEARRLARLIERTGAPVFLYSYEYEIDALSVDHVIHGVESNILFGNNYQPPAFPSYPLDDADLALHSSMAGYWTRFAASGNPNMADDTVVRWPAFKHPTGPGRGADRYLLLDTATREAQRPREAQCDFFEPLFLKSILGGTAAWQ
ncbi:MAG TPA: carboxylesterase family protein [Vicinamibacterales bacterium]|nr:carboxylesterase family protein [Vicinamibacterales bacterium]